MGRPESCQFPGKEELEKQSGWGQVAADRDVTGETPGQVSLRRRWNLEEPAAPQQIIFKA